MENQKKEDVNITSVQWRLRLWKYYTERVEWRKNNKEKRKNKKKNGKICKYAAAWWCTILKLTQIVIEVENISWRKREEERWTQNPTVTEKKKPAWRSGAGEENMRADNCTCQMQSTLNESKRKNIEKNERNWIKMLKQSEALKVQSVVTLSQCFNFRTAQKKKHY